MHTPLITRRATLALLAAPAVAEAARLDTTLPRLLEGPHGVASLSVWLRRPDGSSYSGQWGRRHIGSGGAGLPVTPDTLFRIASVTKLVVALGVMRLVQAGRLDLDADLQTLLGHPLRHPRHPDVPITLRLLLSHRASLTDADASPKPPERPLAPLLGPDSKAWSPHRPGRHFQYCNLAYGVIASAMERASGLRFDALMQREVIAPLGLQASFDAAALPPAQLANVATLYRRPPGGAWVAQTDDFHATPPEPVLPPGADLPLGFNGLQFGPQGRLRIRVADLGTVATMLLQRGGGFLEPESVRALFTEHWRFDPALKNGDTLDGEFQAWGLGVQRFTDRSAPGNGDRLLPGVTAWGHPGFAYGLHSALIVAPERRAAIAFAVGGTTVGPDVPAKGAHSSFAPWEEQLQTLLWTDALR